MALTARLGAGEAKALANECRARLSANAMDWSSLGDLLEATATLGSSVEVERELTAWQNRLPMELRSQAGITFRAVALYSTGKLADCVEHCRRTGGVDLGRIRVQSLLALGRVKEAADDPALAGELDDPGDALAVSLAWRIAGQADEAEKWLRRGLARLSGMGHDARLATAALQSQTPPPLRDIERIHLGARSQALICACSRPGFPHSERITSPRPNDSTSGAALPISS